MTKLILSTSNVMSAGPTVIRKPGTNRSNLELVNSLRGNILAAQADFAAPVPTENGNGPVLAKVRTPLEAWTEKVGDVLFLPRSEPALRGLRDDCSQYEITVKLFLLPGSPVQERGRFVKEALDLVACELGAERIDLLVLSFPGLSFEGDCEWKADKLNAQQGNLDDEVQTWKIVEELHAQGLVKKLGVAEFGSQRLEAFLQRVSVKPMVDQINLNNCCNVPPPLKELAVREGIELNVHIDSTDILPQGTLRELLGEGPQGTGVVAASSKDADGLSGEIVPQWVVRYTAFIRDRGVIENKGYFASADLV